MDNTAFFKLTYGLFVTGVEFEGKLNGCIINTATQATSEPGRLLATMMKTNLTTELIMKKGSMTVSVLAIDCPLDTVAHFGMNKGREMEKYGNIAYETDALGNPYILDGAIARFHCRIEQTIDLGSHFLFVCTVEDCVSLNDREPITYAEYRRLKAGGAPKAAEGQKAASGRWVCSVCHYVYSGEVPFESLPADWKCPVCKRGKDAFVKEG
ncbi:MAG: flavin reductase [Peptococcaceae bacterium]|jgi:flavin reductase (DIM6/NTAB) family NADH-FMN oxidoreductase RutF/rubredoxin|nr:flavin reductase [Peptococcaceae bacterium]